MSENARKSVERIDRLHRRIRQLVRFNQNDAKTGEIAALEWAIPILEKYTLDTKEV